MGLYLFHCEGNLRYFIIVPKCSSLHCESLNVNTYAVCLLVWRVRRKHNTNTFFLLVLVKSNHHFNFCAGAVKSTSTRISPFSSTPVIGLEWTSSFVLFIVCCLFMVSQPTIKAYFFLKIEKSSINPPCWFGLSGRSSQQLAQFKSCNCTFHFALVVWHSFCRKICSKSFLFLFSIKDRGLFNYLSWNLNQLPTTAKL